MREAGYKRRRLERSGGAQRGQAGSWRASALSRLSQSLPISNTQHGAFENSGLLFVSA